MKTVKQILIERDGNTPEEADALIEEAREQVLNGANPEEVLHDEFGLEPDYIFDLL